ncbi:MAG: helix-turn-helix domain-containing protein [Bacteroidaceae bacterium]|nr:helix-turn-helix domain-containing protein [Bacteroidaceae bacterium]
MPPLLQPEHTITPPKGGHLTPELRIFALIRLGVKDIAEIAHFLNYSLPTIYNYRSRIHAIALYPKREFEQRLMEI